MVGQRASADRVPTLVQVATDGQQGEELLRLLGALLGCSAARNEPRLLARLRESRAKPAQNSARNRTKNK